MHKRKLGIVVTMIILCIMIIVCLYAIDLNRMINNEPVIFSTWGYNYASPENKQNPPVLSLTNVSGDIKATCLTSTYNWKDGDAGMIADFPHPVNREYGENNILRIIDGTDTVKEILIDNQNAKIKGVNLYKSQIPNALKYYIKYTDNSIYVDMPDGEEYILQIITEYEQGTVNYCVKVVEQN